jgi:hypothetical protein
VYLWLSKFVQVRTVRQISRTKTEVIVFAVHIVQSIQLNGKLGADFKKGCGHSFRGWNVVGLMR